MRSWVQGNDEGCVRIELHSYLHSPDSVRGARQESQMFGYVNIPLGGLLAAEALQCRATVEIQANMTQHLSVVSKMQSMPYGHQLIRARPLGPSMGTLTVKLCLRPDAETADLAAGMVSEGDSERKVDDIRFDRQKYGLPTNSSSAKNSAVSGTVPPLMTEILDEDAIDARKAEVTNVPDTVEDALQYVPEEAPIVRAGDAVAGNNRSIQDPIPVTLGVALYSIRSVTDANDVQPTAISVRYRVTSQRSGGTRELELNGAQSAIFPGDGGATAEIFDLSDVHTWKKPILEVWNHYYNGQKKLLGLSQLSNEATLGEILELPVINTKGVVKGFVEASLHVHAMRGYVENAMQQCAAFYANAKKGKRSVSVAQTELIANEAARTWAWSDVNSTAVKQSEAAAHPPSPPRWVDKAPRTGSGLAKTENQDLSGDISTDSVNPKTDLAIAILTEGAPGGTSVGSSMEAEDSVELCEEDVPPSVPTVTRRKVRLEDSGPIITLSIPTQIVQNTSSTDSESLASHLLDIKVSGTCDPVEDDRDSSLGLLGCYVQYVFPAVYGERLGLGNETVNLWWDAACAVLGGRHRHQFLSTTKPEFPADISVSIYRSDPDGAVPTGDAMQSLCVGSALLRSEFLTEICARAGGSTTVALPIKPRSGCEAADDICKTLVLQMSHRLEPSMLSKKPDTSNMKKSSEESDPCPNATAAPVRTSINLSTTSTGPPASHIPLVVELQQLAHAPESVMQEATEAALQLLCSASSFGKGSSSARPDFSALIPGYEGMVSKPQTLSGKGSVEWKDQGILWVRGTEDSQPLRKRLRSGSILLQVHSRRLWRGLKPEPSDGPTYLQVGDQLVGSATIDLSPLSFGMDSLEGWYHLQDENKDSTNSQIRVHIRLATSEEVSMYSSTNKKSSSADPHDGHGDTADEERFDGPNDASGRDDSHGAGNDNEDEPFFSPPSNSSAPAGDPAESLNPTTLDATSDDSDSDDVLQRDDDVLELSPEVVEATRVEQPPIVAALLPNPEDHSNSSILSSSSSSSSSSFGSLDEAEIAEENTAMYAMSFEPDRYEESAEDNTRMRVAGLRHLAEASVRDYNGGVSPTPSEVDAFLTEYMGESEAELVRNEMQTQEHISEREDESSSDKVHQPDEESNDNQKQTQQLKQLWPNPEQQQQYKENDNDDASSSSSVDSTEWDVPANDTAATYDTDSLAALDAAELLPPTDAQAVRTSPNGGIVVDMWAAAAIMAAEMSSESDESGDYDSEVVADADHVIPHDADQVEDDEPEVHGVSQMINSDSTDDDYNLAGADRDSAPAEVYASINVSTVSSSDDGTSISSSRYSSSAVDADTSCVSVAAASMSVSFISASADVSVSLDTDADAVNVVENTELNESSMHSDASSTHVPVDVHTPSNTQSLDWAAEVERWEAEGSSTDEASTSRGATPILQTLSMARTPQMSRPVQMAMPSTESPYRRPPTPTHVINQSNTDSVLESDVTEEQSIISESLDASVSVSESPSLVQEEASHDIEDNLEHTLEASIESQQSGEVSTDVPVETSYLQQLEKEQSDEEKEQSDEEKEQSDEEDAHEIADTVDPVIPRNILQLSVPSVDETLRSPMGNGMDTPVTSKIRMVARQEVNRALAAEARANNEGNSVENDESSHEATSPLATSGTIVSEQPEPLLQQDTLVTPVDVENTRPLSAAELISRKVSHALREASKRAAENSSTRRRTPLMRAPGAKFPDNQKQFVDSEMERISRIMLGGI